MLNCRNVLVTRLYHEYFISYSSNRKRVINILIPESAILKSR